jgi:hypothetical protein
MVVDPVEHGAQVRFGTEVIELAVQMRLYIAAGPWVFGCGGFVVGHAPESNSSQKTRKGLQALRAINLAKRAIESAQGQIPGLTRDLQYQAVGEVGRGATDI